MLKVQEYILKYGLKSLQDKYFIEIKEYNDRVVLNYNQIDSPKNDELVNDCRGLILSKDFQQILNRPFTRFFNYSEGFNPDFNFSKSCALEKLDGTLISLYFDNKNWCISTRKSAFAENGYNELNVSFYDLFIKSSPWENKEHFENFCNIYLKDYKNFTFNFELIGPENKIVTYYENPEIVILSARNKITGKYLKILQIQNIFQNLIRIPKIFKLKSLNDINNYLKHLELNDPLYEGLVIFNPFNNERIKMKNISYLKFHCLRCQINPSLEKKIELVVTGEIEEYLSYFPMDLTKFNDIKEIFKNFKINCLNVYNKIKEIENQKDFAKEALKYKFSNFLFKMKQEKNSFNFSNYNKEIIRFLLKEIKWNGMNFWSNENIKKRIR